MTASSPSFQTHGKALLYPGFPGLSRWGVVGVATAHIGVLALLFSLENAPAIPALTPLMVRMIPTVPVAETAPSTARTAAPENLEKASKNSPRRPTHPEPRPVAEQSPASSSAKEIPSAQPAPSAPPAESQSGKSAEAVVGGNTPPAGALANTPVSAARFDADYLRNPAPAYPPLARRLREEGKVILRVFVTPEGTAGQVELRSSSGFPRLDQAAREAVSRWKFVPARRGDESIGAWVLIPVVFNLNN